MPYKVARNKEEGLTQLSELVTSFKNGEKSFKSSKYNETQFRNDFLDPFLMSFGWDVDNDEGKTQFLRDVIQEESIEVEDETSKKNPDYTLRIHGIRKLFVEGKKPSVDIGNSPKAAFQTRRYGWNAKLGISILSNFNQLVIYDCRYKPDIKDGQHVARIVVFDFEQYITSFDEIYSIISFDSAFTGRLDELYSTYERVGQTFDDYFLLQIENWRNKLGKSAVQRNTQLGSEQINFLIQRLLNRIIFLRICEDRTIEKHETLKNIKDYNELKSLFQQSDRKYNSGLFNFIEDNLSLNIQIDSDVLIEIFNDLYYPLSPYNFAIVDPSILSQIYEKFLGSHVVLDENRILSIVSEPEVVASNGVVPTPKIIVEQIVSAAISPLVIGKSSQQLSQLKIADICCGSGTFLLSIYDFLLKSTIEKYQEEGVNDPQLIYELSNHTLALTLKAKRNVLEGNIFGVDINPYAVEVAEFSLLLKLLEGETDGSIDNFINQYAGRILPSLKDNIKCGNSLVDDTFFEFMPEALSDDNLLLRIKPFNWKIEFPFLNLSGGFDAIVGNPPYVRIQNLVKYSPEEIKYYQHPLFGYAVVKKETFDKYYVFIERAIALLGHTGFLGYIVPHKFFVNKGGKELRKLISESSSISKIIHFGVAQVFPDRSTYTAILVLQREKTEILYFKQVKKITPELLGVSDGYTEYDNNKFRSDPWIFLSIETEKVFNKMRSEQTVPLKSLAEICVGVQTSKDEIFIFIPENETDTTYIFSKNKIVFQVEKAICAPCLMDFKFDLFDSVQPNAQMIFPYVVKAGKAELITEEYLHDHFPLCWSYLNINKAVLIKRAVNGKNPKWYQFGRSQSLTRFQDTEKLIWKVLSTGPSYIYDDINTQFTGGGNGPYYSLVNNSDYSILYFMGILAHPVIELMVKAGASVFRGSYYSHGKQFIKNIPIKNINLDDEVEVKLYKDIVESVKRILVTKKQYNEANGQSRNVLNRKISFIKNTLINSINKLYGIDDTDYNTVLNDEMFKNELIEEEE